VASPWTRPAQKFRSGRSDISAPIPNLGELRWVVSLGCEKLQPERLFPEQRLGKLPVLESDPYLIRMQDEHGFGEIVSAIMRAAETRLEQLNGGGGRRYRQRKLVVACSAVGSDGFSGVTCNPAVGYAADLLVRAEAGDVLGSHGSARCGSLADSTAINEDVARALIREMRWYDDYLACGRRPQRESYAGQQARRIVECSGEGPRVNRKAGSFGADGSRCQGEKVTAKGLVFAATPAS